MALAHPGNSDAVVRRILESILAGEPYPALALDDSRDDGELRQQVWLVSERVGLPKLYQHILSFVLPKDDVLSMLCRWDGDNWAPLERDDMDVMREFGMDMFWCINFELPGGRELEFILATKNGRIGVERLHEVMLALMVSLPDIERSDLDFDVLGRRRPFLLFGGLGPTRPIPAHFNVLRNPSCNLTDLDVSHHRLNDELAYALADALVGNSTLTSMRLAINPDVTPVGWHAIAGILSQPLSALENLNLSGNSVNDEVVNAFADALVGNSRLRCLDLWQNNDITTAGLEVFSQVLCNTTSVIATYDSNHTLQCLFRGSDREASDRKASDEIKSLLRLNAFSLPWDSARLKIINTHFREEGDGQLFQELGDMEPAVLPDAIAWMGRDEHLYLFLRKMPWHLSELAVSQRQPAVSSSLPNGTNDIETASSGVLHAEVSASLRRLNDSEERIRAKTTSSGGELARVVVGDEVFDVEPISDDVLKGTRAKRWRLAAAAAVLLMVVAIAIMAPLLSKKEEPECEK